MTSPARPRVGVIVLPEHDLAGTAALWCGLEDLGVDHAWTVDHHSWREFRDRPWFDAVCTLAAVAAVTRRLSLGTLVSTPNLRHPAVLAKQAMTLDRLSGGRFSLGLGSGAAGPDARLLGGEPVTGMRLADRFAEFVALTDRLLRDPVTDHEGRWFSARDARMVPGCVRQPRLPFVVAAAGDRAMDVAVRHAEIWTTSGDPARIGLDGANAVLAELARQSRRVDEACERAGRRPDSLGRLANLSRVTAEPYSSPDRFEDLVGTMAELGFTDVVVYHPRPDGPFAGGRAAFEAAIGRVLSQREPAEGHQGKPGEPDESWARGLAGQEPVCAS